MPKLKEITQFLQVICQKIHPGPSSDVLLVFLYIFVLSEVLMVRFQKGTSRVPKRNTRVFEMLSIMCLFSVGYNYDILH